MKRLESISEVLLYWFIKLSMLSVCVCVGGGGEVVSELTSPTRGGGRSKKLLLY